MLETIALQLIEMWAPGLRTGHATGGIDHLLLPLAVVLLATSYFTGRKFA